MSTYNIIQAKIRGMNGGEFEKLFYSYVMKKYRFENVRALGTQEGTNNTRKGTPDAYTIIDGKYVLITCGKVEGNPVQKIKKDIQACFDNAKTGIEKNKISKIICGFCSSYVSIKENEDICSLIDGVEIIPIGIDVIAHDILYKFPSLSKIHLNLPIDSHQLFDINDFIDECDKSKTNAPIKSEFFYRNEEISHLKESIRTCAFTIVTGASGIGKTRLAVEACRYYNGEYEIYCAKSNGKEMYDDIVCRVEHAGNYIFMFDDANTISDLEGCIDHIISLPESFNVKMIFTVRDYASKRLINLLKQISPEDISFISLSTLNDEEIMGILQHNLKIRNSGVLRNIADIAKGNVRIAMLAGKKYIDGGLTLTNSPKDIYINYYDAVLKDAGLTEEQIMMLFIIGISGPVVLCNNDFYDELKRDFYLDKNGEDILQSLCLIELVDFFDESLIQIPDQSLKDYILYNVLYENKKVSIEAIIDRYFLDNKGKIIDAINVLLNIYASEELFNYTFEQINNAWNNADKKIEVCFVEAFHYANPIRALVWIKKQVQEEDKVEYQIDVSKIQNEKIRTGIRSDVIKILSDFKDCECFSDSLDLMLCYFDKRPDLYEEFYTALTHGLIYDENSYYQNYKFELLIIEKMWAFCDGGNKQNATLLYLSILEEYLRTYVSSVKTNMRGKTVWRRLNLPLTEGMKQLRTVIWKSLFELRENEVYKRKVNSLISQRHINGLDEKGTKEYLQFDFEVLCPLIHEEIDFYAAKALHQYYEDAVSLNMSIDERWQKALENEQFRIYLLLEKCNCFRMANDEVDEPQKQSVCDEVKDFSMDRFEELFICCNFFEKELTFDRWLLGTGLGYVFEIFENDTTKYIPILAKFFEHDAPLIQNDIYRITNNLYIQMGYEQTKEYIQLCDKSKQELWMNRLFGCINDIDISDEVVRDFKAHINRIERCSPEPKDVLRYSQRDDSIIKDLLYKINRNLALSESFLQSLAFEEDICIYIDAFASDIDMLSIVYINALGTQVDFDGKLFCAIYGAHHQIWEKYVEYLCDDEVQGEYELSIIDKIWKMDKCESLIDYAFDQLYERHRYLLAKLFNPDYSLHETEKKKSWIIDKLKNKVIDVERFSCLTNIGIYLFPECKMDFLQEFIRHFPSLDDFKRLTLTRNIQRTSESITKIINGRIRNLQEIYDNLSGVNTLEHRLYLEELIYQQEQIQKEARIREQLA